MSNRNGSQPTDWPGGSGNNGATSGQGQDALRQALSGLGGGGALTSENLAELARRAGLTDPARVADLGRMIGLDSSMSTSAVPQHIFFMLDEAECALAASAVQGVERLSDVAMVPNTAPWVLGVVQVWGAIISVVDLRRFVGLPPQPPTNRSRLLVVTRREMAIGFVVDAVTEMRALGDVAIGPVDGRTTPAWAMPYTQGSIHVEGRAATVLDPDRLLFSEKIHHYRADQG